MAYSLVTVSLENITIPNEFGSMTAIKDNILPEKTIKLYFIFSYKAIQDHIRIHKAMLILTRPHMVMAVKSKNTTIKGHIRPYKATQCHTRP